jgi:hypothetical protein
MLHEGVCKLDACTAACLKKRQPSGGLFCCGGRSFASECLAACYGAKACQPGGCSSRAFCAAPSMAPAAGH